MKPCKERRQDFRADDFAGGDAHHAGASLAPPEAARIIEPAAAAMISAWGAISRAAIGRHQAALRPDEQGRPQLALQLGDLPAQRGLREAEIARRSGKRAVAQNGEKGAVVAPVGLYHTNMYIISRI